MTLQENKASQLTFSSIGLVRDPNLLQGISEGLPSEEMFAAIFQAHPYVTKFSFMHSIDPFKDTMDSLKWRSVGELKLNELVNPTVSGWKDKQVFYLASMAAMSIPEGQSNIQLPFLRFAAINPEYLNYTLPRVAQILNDCKYSGYLMTDPYEQSPYKSAYFVGNTFLPPKKFAEFLEWASKADDVDCDYVTQSQRLGFSVVPIAGSQVLRVV